MPLIAILLAMLIGAGFITISYLFFAKLFAMTLLLVIAAFILLILYAGYESDNPPSDRIIGLGLVLAIGLSVFAVLVYGPVGFSAVQPNAPSPFCSIGTCGSNAGVTVLSQFPPGQVSGSAGGGQLTFFGAIGANMAGWGGPGAWSAGNMLDQPYYVSSLYQNGQSEKIFIQSAVCTQGTALHIATATYSIYLSTGGSWPSSPSATWPAGTPNLPLASVGCFPMNAPVYQITGPFVGWISVRLTVAVQNAFGGDQGTGEVLRSDAMVLNNAAQILQPTQGTVFATGSTISVQVQLGYACSGSKAPGGNASQAGYTLSLYTEGQGQTVKQWNLGCGSTGIAPITTTTDAGGNPITYVVNPADFSNAGGTCKNTLTFTLYSNLFIQQVRDVKSIDLNLATKPAKPTISVSSTTPYVNDTVSFKIVPANGTAVKEYSYQVAYTTGLQLLNSQHSQNASASFTVPVAGVITITGQVTNNACGASDPVQVVIVAYSKNSGGANNPLSWPWAFILAMVATVFAVGLGVYFIPDETLGQDADKVKVAIAVVVILVLALVYIEAGLLVPFVQKPFAIAVDHAGRLLGV